MNNEHSASPCQVVAQLNAICNGGSAFSTFPVFYPDVDHPLDWVVPAINSTTHYDNPSNDPAANTASFCTW